MKDTYFHTVSSSCVVDKLLFPFFANFSNLELPETKIWHKTVMGAGLKFAINRSFVIGFGLNVHQTMYFLHVYHTS